MKKILFVVSTLDTGGAQRILANISLELPSDYEVTFVLNDTKNIAYPFKGKVIDLGFEEQEDKEKMSYLLKVFLKRIKILHSLKKTKEYVACISALESANGANILTKNKNCKTIVTVHNCMSETKISTLKKGIIYLVIHGLYNRADRIVTVSKGIKKDLIEHYRVKPQKIETIYNGFTFNYIEKDANELLDQKEKMMLSSSEHILVNIGRLVEQKGQWHLIRALTLVKEKIPDVRLLILGEGPLRKYLTKIIQELNLNENVYMPGFVENPYHLIRKCQLCVLPSLYEGFGNAILEAMACGVPCLASDYKYGAREIFESEEAQGELGISDRENQEYGVLIPVCSGEMLKPKDKLQNEELILANTIIELLSNEEEREMYRARGVKCIARFDMKNIIKQWIQVIEIC